MDRILSPVGMVAGYRFGCRCLPASLLVVLFLLVVSFRWALAGSFPQTHSESPVTAGPRVLEPLHAPYSDELTQSVYSPYSYVSLNQIDVPVEITVSNVSSSPVIIQYISPVFYVSEPGDRQGDYLVSGDTSPDIVILPGEDHTFAFSIDVRSDALTDTEITVDAVSYGVRLDDYGGIVDSTAEARHTWIVLEQAISVTLALFDTRMTQERSDDSLICYVPGEMFSLNSVYYVNYGNVLGDVVMDDASLYRLVVQMNATADWDCDPTSSMRGFIALDGGETAFGDASSPVPGLKEFLLSMFFVPDAKDGPLDILVGCTRDSDPAVKWNMMTDPFDDPDVDDEKTDEIGTLADGGARFGRVVDCVDGDSDWDVTGSYEFDRYYFYEIWFMPDFDWQHGDTADVVMHIKGLPEPNDIDELHMLFRVLDDDVIPPEFSEFDPTVVPQGESFLVSCRITDESGVFDESQGSSGQGVYLKWDTDGELDYDYNETTMSNAYQDYYVTDWEIGPFMDGTEIVYRVCACDDDSDGGNADDRNCGCSDVQSITVTSRAYVVDDPLTLYPSWAYRGETEVSFHIDVSNPSSYGLWLYPTSALGFTDGADTVWAYLNNWTWIVSGASNFTLSFSPVDIPLDFNAPDTLRLILDFEGQDEYGSYFSQRWVASDFNTLYILEPTIHFAAHSIPYGSVNPGQKGKPLLLFEVVNDSPFGASIDSFVVSNATRGAAAVPMSDLEFGDLYLFRYLAVGSIRSVLEDGASLSLPGDGDDVRDIPGKVVRGDGKSVRRITFHTSNGIRYPSYVDEVFSRGDSLLQRDSLLDSDSLVAVSRFSNGNAKFSVGASGYLPPGASVYFFVLADVDSFLATDGDSLDVEILDSDSVFTMGVQSRLFHGSPLNSEGASIVDGFMSYQLKLEDAGVDTLFSGDTLRTILKALLPVNGYLSDVLEGLAIKNFSGPEADTHLNNLSVWIDNGDGILNVSEDSLIASLYYTGEYFVCSGLRHIIDKPRYIFVTADIAEDFSGNLSLQFGFPLNGVLYASGNDGPIDAEVYPSSPITVVRREYVSIDPIGLSGGVVHPGESEAELLGFSVKNRTLGAVTLDSLRVRLNSSMGPCDFIQDVRLFADNGDELFDALSDTMIAYGSRSGDEVVFEGVNSVIEESSTRGFFVVSGIDSFTTVDGITLGAFIADRSDIYISRYAADTFDVEGSFPVVSHDCVETDGMMSFQVDLRSPPDSTIIDKKVNIEILSFELHGNGCLDDTLNALKIANYGSAGSDHIESLSLWMDNGDGSFDPQWDDSVAQFLQLEEGVYSLSGLSIPVSADSGKLFFITANLKELIETGATIVAAIPIMGIEVSSGNDGPIDKDLVSESSIIIPVPDRITFFTSILGNKRVRPGDSNILNMVLGAYNSYKTPQKMESLTILNVGSVSPEEIAEVRAYMDLNGDGLFEESEDSLLQVATITEGGYLFENLDFSLSPFKNSVLFITYSLMEKGVRDSVKVDFQVSDKSSMVFGDEAVNVQGDFPLNSAGVDITDGMLASQMKALVNGSSRVSPRDRDVPCFSLILPCNGTVEDILEGLEVQNYGTAVAGSDIEYLRVWKETGLPSSGFDPSSDEFLDFLAWDGSVWRTISTLSDTILCSGLVLHVTADVAPSAADGRTIRLYVPLRGVEVYSGNDGPIDVPFESPDIITITTDPLFSSVLAPDRVTAGQRFDVVMEITNAADTSLLDVEPDSFSYHGDGGIVLLSGPEPRRIEVLPGQCDSAFVWTFEASSSGHLVFCGKAHETSGDESSVIGCSDTLFIDKVPENFKISMEDLAPVSINRGRDNVAIFQMNLKYDPPDGEGASVEFSGLRVGFEDGAGTPIASGSVASLVRIEDNERILGSVSVAGSTASDVEVLSQQYSPVFVPGDSSIVRLSICIPDTAEAEDFRITIGDASWIMLSDVNSGEPVPPVGASFPWSSNDVALKDPARVLSIKSTPLLPERINKGQQNIEAVLLTLENNNGPSAADVSVSEILFRVIGSSGDTLTAQDVLDFFSLKDDLGNSYFATSNLSSKLIDCKFNPSLAVSTGIPLNLHVFLDCSLVPSVDTFSIVVVEPLCITARDVNSGQVVEVVSDTLSGTRFPLSSGQTSVLAPVREVSVSWEPGLPDVVTASSVDLHAMTLIVSHPGTSDESPVRCDGLAIVLLNERGDRIEPFGLLQTVKVESRGGEVGSVHITGESTSLLSVPFHSPLVLQPGEEDTLDVVVVLSSDARSGLFQLHINSGAIIFHDFTDGNRVNDVSGDFPATSGICEVVQPTSQVVVGARPLFPPNVAAGGEVGVFDLGFSVDDTSNSMGAVLERLGFDVVGAGGSRIDPSSVVEGVSIEVGSSEISSTWRLLNGGVEVELEDSVLIRHGDETVVTLKVSIAKDPSVGLFAVRIPSGDDIYCIDALDHSRVSVTPLEGDEFPFVSGYASILTRDIAGSFTNYPNPFTAGREKTRITFYLPEDGRVTLRVFTLTGVGVKTIVDNEHLAGGLYQDYYWDGRNGKGFDVLSGVYYLVLDIATSSGTHRYMRKVAVVR